MSLQVSRQTCCPAPFSAQCLEHEYHGLIGKAFRRYAAGDPSFLVAFLRSEASLPERQELAEIAERAANPPGGRPADHDLWATANWARSLYREWKACNRACRLNNTGRAEEMKNRCCRYAIDLMAPWDEAEPDVEKVREYMDRPKERWPRFWQKVSF